MLVMSDTTDLPLHSTQPCRGPLVVDLHVARCSYIICLVGVKVAPPQGREERTVPVIAVDSMFARQYTHTLTDCIMRVNKGRVLV